MSVATLTSKGQTTIPQDIRDFLALHTGDKIEFLVEDNHVIMTPLTADVTELKGMLPKPRKKISIEAMKHAIIKRGTKT
jgi:antitoxin PrlF